MPSDLQSNILGKLDSVIANIHCYTQKPTDFIRNRKLNATTTIKTTLNMLGNSLVAEL